MNRLLIIALLLGNMQLWAKSPAAWQRLQSSWQQASRGIVTKLSHVGTAALLSVALVAAPQQLVYGEEEADDPAAVFAVVDAGSPSTHHGVFLLHVSLPPAQDGDDGVEYGFHLAFIGVDADGNSVLIARERHSGVNVQDKLSEAGAVALHGWDGLIADSVDAQVTDIFADATDGVFDVIAVTISGVNLMKNYPPLSLSNGFPYASVVDLELLTYRLHYTPKLTEEEMAADAFTLRWRQCENVPQAMLANIDVGLNTCGGVGINAANSSPILKDGQLVALQSSPSTVLDADDNPVSWWSSGIPIEVVNYAAHLNGAAASVNPAGKLATTWGSIKTTR